MNCPACDSQSKRFGKDRKGHQRYRCLSCQKTFLEPRDKPLGGMYLPIEKAVLCLKLLVEGCSVRSIERLTGIHRDTVLDLLVTVGDKCERLGAHMIQGLKVQDVQVDEIWGFVQMKEKTKKRKEIVSNKIGDSYTFTAIDRDTKLMLAWHVGRRSAFDTETFIEKLGRATVSSFQLTSDGYAGYPEEVSYELGTRVDYSQLVKMYSQDSQAERRYSPAICIGAKKVPVIGDPAPERICTSHVERANLTIRMHTRRLTRLTNGFSKKFANLKAAMNLHFMWYNFIRVHSSLRVTPGMEAGLTDRVWNFEDLLKAATQF